MAYPSVGYPWDYPIPNNGNDNALHDALFAHMDKDLSIASATVMHGKPFRGNIYQAADFVGDVVAPRGRVLQPAKNPYDR